jgi:hypothetical protein
MDTRSKEDLRTIYEDLLELRVVLNDLHDRGELWPIPMNGKTWQEEKDEFYNHQIDELGKLLEDNLVKSCQIKTLCEFIIKDCIKCKGIDGFWSQISRRAQNSKQYEPTSTYSIDEMIDVLERYFSSSGTDTELKKLDAVLEEIGTSACEARAFLVQPNCEKITSSNNIPFNSNRTITNMYLA